MVPTMVPMICKFLLMNWYGSAPMKVDPTLATLWVSADILKFEGKLTKTDTHYLAPNPISNVVNGICIGLGRDNEDGMGTNPTTKPFHFCDDIRFCPKVDKCFCA